ncbi:hypothetical protein Poli38472_008282 [Pythium oligandrum]|uniref:Uncharacterized protein n=1 Tax=Pythium oligandrum TaxID=41045 RepID=A0A8K1FJ29_PYTOL|nr:hypothetical protein Poli38472_008282 [Pythium oligandrum]|eukprot:TMW65640.1 hypothetical protein Poli38472_008282 [Pythium oligandrum]
MAVEDYGEVTPLTEHEDWMDISPRSLLDIYALEWDADVVEALQYDEKAGNESQTQANGKDEDVESEASEASTRRKTSSQDKSDSQSPRPKRRRVNRLREELKDLRKVVEGLEMHLRLLKLGRDQSNGSVQAEATTSTQLIQPRAMWKAVALRQHDRRRESELENSRLRMLLDEQMRIAQGLERLIQRSVTSMLNPRYPTPLALNTSPADYAALARATNDLYLLVDQAMNERRFEDLESELREISVHEDSIEMLGGRIAPLSCDLLTGGIWQSFVEPSRLNPSYQAQCVVDIPDYNCSTFTLKLDTVGRRGIFRGNVALRRFQEKSRCVFTIVSYLTRVEPAEVSGLVFRSHGIVERQQGLVNSSLPTFVVPEQYGMTELAKSLMELTANWR